jgi:HK97 gp10 family phage protein
LAEKTRVQVLGLRELGANLQALGEDIAKKVARAATNAGAQVIKKAAVRNAPVSDPALTPNIPAGYMRDSIIVRRQRRPDKGLTSQHAVTVRHKGAKVLADAPNPYQVGIFNEFGTVKMSAQPFMRPAFDSGKSEALDAIVKRLKQRIDKANKAKR